MSADRQRLKSAIQRIAKEDPQIRDLLGEGKNRGGKSGSAGVGASEAEESRLCCDGSTSSSANPGTSERDPSEGGQDGLNSDDPAKLESGDGALYGVTDCETGEPICFDGQGFVPPDGWEDYDVGPVAASYEDGSYFVSTYDSNIIGQTADSVCSQMSAGLDGEHCGAVYSDSSNLWLCQRDLGDSVSTTGGCSTYTPQSDYAAFREDCTPEQSADESHPCGMPPPSDGAWPSDGCANLAIAGGKIVGSKYDPENDGSYSAPRDSIDLCDGNGNQISLAPAANGGWKTINSTNDSGYLYDSSGKQIAHIDGNEYSDPNV